MKMSTALAHAAAARGSITLALLVGLATAAPTWAQPPADTPPPAKAGAGETSGAGEESNVKEVDKAGAPSVRRARLSRYLTGATFTGAFTVDGMEDRAPKAESYTITSCEPLAEENRYRLKVKIRYGDVDGEFPMDLDILWAGQTPVITLDALAIPGLGTFSSRVLIHNGRYAGTWQHGDKGGHLYGKITTPAE